MSFMPCRSKQRAVAISTAIAVATLIGGCAGRDQLPYHVIHNPVDGKPRHIFADPIGYRYPDIVPTARPVGVAPLPLQRRTYFDFEKGNSRQKALPSEPAGAPKLIGPTEAPAEHPSVKPAPQPSQKQTILRPARDRIAVVKATESATDPVPRAPPAAGVPTVEVVPPLTGEGRASTQLRR